MSYRFRDRPEAGRLLANKLMAYANQPDVCVVGLPRGGVPVAYEVARALRAPLDVLVVRKLGVPSQPELAMGAIASGGVRVLNEDVIRECRVSMDDVESVTERERAELVRRERAYRAGRPAPELHDKTVIIVDDGLATGTTMRAAVLALSQSQPKQLIVAVPAASEQACQDFHSMRQVSRCVCMSPPPAPYSQAVGLCYEDFAQVSDEEVQAALKESAIPATRYDHELQ